MLLTAPAAARSTTLDPVVHLHQLTSGDRAPLLEIFAGLSPRSRQRRFLTAKPRLTESDLRQLTAVDDQDHVAIVAVSARHGRPVGVARFVRESGRPDSADVAVSVVDAWQGRGIGTLLTRALARRAREVGVRRFTVMMQRDNEAALGLLHSTGGAVTRLAVDAETVELAVEVG